MHQIDVSKVRAAKFAAIAISIAFCANVQQSKSLDMDTLVSYRIDSSEPVELNVSLCGSDFKVFDAEQKHNEPLRVRCFGQKILEASVKVGGREFHLTRGSELYSARRVFFDIRIGAKVVEETTYDSLFCPSYDEICDHHDYPSFYSRFDGHFIDDPSSPLLDDEQQKSLKDTLARVKVTQ